MSDPMRVVMQGGTHKIVVDSDSHKVLVDPCGAGTLTQLICCGYTQYWCNCVALAGIRSGWREFQPPAPAPPNQRPTYYLNETRDCSDTHGSSHYENNYDTPVPTPTDNGEYYMRTSHSSGNTDHCGQCGAVWQDATNYACSSGTGSEHLFLYNEYLEEDMMAEIRAWIPSVWPTRTYVHCDGVSGECLSGDRWSWSEPSYAFGNPSYPQGTLTEYFVHETKVKYQFAPVPYEVRGYYLLDFLDGFDPAYDIYEMSFPIVVAPGQTEYEIYVPEPYDGMGIGRHGNVYIYGCYAPTIVYDVPGCTLGAGMAKRSTVDGALGLRGGRERPVMRPVVRDEWPVWAKLAARIATPADRGIGDVIERTIGPARSKAFQDWYERLFGRKCGCERRRREWNVKYPLRDSGQLTVQLI